MHEMSIAESIVEIAEEAARRAGAIRVRTVFAEIGALAGVEIEALRFCWDAVTREGLAAGAGLDITQIPGQAWCIECSEAIVLLSSLAACPHCGGYQVAITGGTEMRVREIAVE